MPSLLVILNPLICWGGIEQWMQDLFPRMMSKNWKVRFALTHAHWGNNNPRNIADRNSYMVDYRVIDGRGGSPRSRQNAIINEIKNSSCDVVMPIGVGYAFPALRQYRHAGGQIRTCIPVHIHAPETLADIA